MANRRNQDDRQNDFDDFEEELDDWDEELDEDDEYDDDVEDEDIDEDDIENDPRLLKMAEKAQQLAIESVVGQLSEGNTDSPVYKGLQRVISKKDAEIRETREALAGLASRMIELQQGVGGTNSDTEFLISTLKDLLDPDSREQFEQRYETHKKGRTEKSELEQMKAAMQYFMAQQQGQQSVEEDPRLTEYRQRANTELREYVQMMGVDPDNPDIDYGDPQEGLVDRMVTVRQSLKKIKDDDDAETNSVRSKRRPTSTRTDNSPGISDRSPLGRSSIDKAMADAVKKMRQGIK